jgi:hypothetical protein
LGREPSYQELAKESRIVIDANGFSKPTLKNILEKLMLTITEVKECKDNLIDGSGDPYTEELADIALRIMDILESIWPDDWYLDECSIINELFPVYRCPESYMFPIIDDLSAVAELCRYNDEEKIKMSLIETLETVINTSYAIPGDTIDLIKEIQSKIAKNRKRGYLHGKNKSI